MARDGPALAGFYVAVFGLCILRPRRALSGPLFARGLGLDHVAFHSTWLGFPGANAPFLEIFDAPGAQFPGLPEFDWPGFRHLAVAVGDLQHVLSRALAEGGTRLGEPVDLGTPDHPCLAVYLRDPEGNLLELEQI
ncbi:MAG: glyoxalase/bleomycin resistance/dioxygenase family protein [Rhodobacteraceae bacterium]|nr:glyoxalase/bleomycin resistance/dioxygenase family protein [Paracoccaceae bacterium]